MKGRCLAPILGVLFIIGVPIHGSTLQVPKTPSRSSAAPAPENRVDINTATLDQLLKVPGITRTWAARIIRFRPYRAKSDLIDKGVVTSEVYDRIKDHIIAHRQAR